MFRMRDLGAAALTWLGALMLVFAVAVPMAARAGTAAIDNSVALDPFSPVPEIQFSRGCDYGCGDCDGCGWHHCYHECGGCWHDCHRAGWSGGWHDGWRDCDHGCRFGTWYCENGCRNNWYGEGWRDCDSDCREGSWHCARGCARWYRELLREYDAKSDRNEDQADRYDEQAARYDAQSFWYQRHVIDHDRWYDGHAWHIAPLLPLPDIFPGADAGAPPPGPYDAPPGPGPYYGPPPQ